MFRPGEQVYVPRLKKFGKILEERSGVFRVVIGSLVMECQKEELLAVNQAPKSAQRQRVTAAQRVSVQAQGRVTERLDLHGLSVDEAVRRLEKAIDEALLSSLSRLEVIHGKGTGKIRNAVHQYVKGLSAVLRYEEDIANTGVTWIYFKE